MSEGAAAGARRGGSRGGGVGSRSGAARGGPREQEGDQEVQGAGQTPAPGNTFSRFNFKTYHALAVVLAMAMGYMILTSKSVRPL